MDTEIVRRVGAPPKGVIYDTVPTVASTKRMTTETTPMNSAASYTYSGNNYILFKINQSGYLDTRNSYICFQFKPSADTVMLSDGSMSIIKEIRISNTAGTTLEHIQDAHLLSKILHRCTVSDDYRDSYGSAYGHGDAQTRAAWMSESYVSPKWYCLDLGEVSGLMSLKRYLPMKFIQGGLDIRIDLENPTYSCYAVSATPNYTITNPRLISDTLEFEDTPKFDAAFAELLSRSGVEIEFQTYNRHQRTLTTSGVHNVEISEASASIKSIYTVFQPDSLYSSPSTKDTLALWPRGTFSGGLIDYYQFKVGNKLYPTFRQNCGAGAEATKPGSGQFRALVERQKGFNMMGRIDTGGSNEPNKIALKTVAISAGVLTATCAYPYEQYSLFNGTTTTVPSNKLVAIDIVDTAASASTTMLPYTVKNALSFEVGIGTEVSDTYDITDYVNTAVTCSIAAGTAIPADTSTATTGLAALVTASLTAGSSTVVCDASGTTKLTFTSPANGVPIYVRALNEETAFVLGIGMSISEVIAEAANKPVLTTGVCCAPALVTPITHVKGILTAVSTTGFSISVSDDILNQTYGTGVAVVGWAECANKSGELSSNNFVIAQNFETHMDGDEEYTGAGESTSSALPITLNLDWSADSGENVRMTSFVYKDQRLHIGMDGITRIYE